MSYFVCPKCKYRAISFLCPKCLTTMESPKHEAPPEPRYVIDNDDYAFYVHDATQDESPQLYICRTRAEAEAFIAGIECAGRRR